MASMSLPEFGLAPRTIARNWQWALAAVAIAALALFSRQTLIELHERWLAVSFTGGYVMLLLAGALAYRAARRSAATAEPRHSAYALLLLAAGVFASLVGRAADVAIVAHVAFPLLVVAIAWAIFGWHAVHRFWPALLFVYFAIPFWQVLDFLPIDVPSFNEGLRVFTTAVVSSMVYGTGITAFIEGNYVHLPSGTFEIAEGCSGRAFFVAAVQLALFYGLMYLDRSRPRALLVVAAAGLALVANWVRVYAIIVVGHLSEMRHALVADHATFGWILFLLLVVAPIAVIGRRLESAVRRDVDAPRAPAVTAQPSTARHPFAGRLQPVQARKLLPPALAIVVLAVGIGLDARVQAARSTSVESRAIVLPAVAGWSRGGEWHGDRRPLYVDAPAEASAWYLQGEQRIGVYVANYPAQRQGSEAVYYANRPQGTATAEKVVARSRVAVSSAEDSARFGEWIVAGPASRRILWHGIRVAGRSTGDEIVAKLHQVAGALMGRNDAQVLILTAECDTDCAAARRLLFVFSEQAAATLYARAEQSAALD